MLKTLTALLSGKSGSKQKGLGANTLIKPDEPFFCVGDIHGCHLKMLEILAKIQEAGSPSEPVVMLGDVIDRGPESARVLTHLFDRSKTRPDMFIVLMGNHERMLLEFIDDPAGRGTRWLANGGIDTLSSFGITNISQRPDAEEAMEASNVLEQNMPDGMLAWLRTRPLSWSSGNVFCVHAAMNPNRAPDKQNERTLLWGHPEFLSRAREDNVTVVHGHTIVHRPSVQNGRVAIDTGAYKGKPLTAAHIVQDEVSFLQV